jgi:hypothetical protein
MRTKLGQRARAVEGLRELLLVTRDIDARKKLIDRLSTLVNTDSLELAAEIFEERHHFEAAWQRDRPMISPTMYVLLGPPLAPSFDMVDLATGGADLVGSQPVVEKLEPLD